MRFSILSTSLALAVVACLADVQDWGDRVASTHSASFRTGAGERVIIRLGDAIDELKKVEDAPLPYGHLIFAPPPDMGTNVIVKFSLGGGRAWFFAHDGSVITNMMYSPLRVVPASHPPYPESKMRSIGPLIIEEGWRDDL